MLFVLSFVFYCGTHYVLYTTNKKMSIVFLFFFENFDNQIFFLPFLSNVVKNPQNSQTVILETGCHPFYYNTVPLEKSREHFCRSQSTVSFCESAASCAIF